ncbi:dTDP-4-dehydrorhamnose 3,5-epimerase [Acetivibrio thermocellus]|uniref:dTDP-4-dehydrorhamnose 3,5-epimerase n=1 Tax=Acetivibrio thermocellus TaxID=1515 RepID=UPI0010A6643A|nr:dTDP-4-dehydrorhamnose 3,5-epimerase [Acetivibrio thermocellus]NLU26101.1 dTDP-4-dehydrorhamnose 3,5-epimerase [Acetivibrio thermocellus]THJ78015.1 dTDP-4-dehydrorhamnose 3,5-epimerase [Acetivibrio thermocellus]UWV47797.1 dTDP-4-dehydrorhamnose 3,5-epimerase [Acetivibrio thermocellus]
MNNFTVVKTPIEGLVVVEPKIFTDTRGFFFESYNKKAFCEFGLTMEFVQDNHIKSRIGVLRGIHFQRKFPQGRLVRVIKGKVYDVAVDLRKNSPTFGKWYGIELSAENKKMFYIPENFGHAFLTLEDDTEVLCKTTNVYRPEFESGIIYNDPELNIDWPQIEGDIVLSEKDKNLPTFKNAELD